MGFRLQHDEIVALVNLVDDDCNGCIDFDEFLMMMRYCREAQRHKHAARRARARSLARGAAAAACAPAQWAAERGRRCGDVLGACRTATAYSLSRDLRGALVGPIHPGSSVAYNWHMWTMAFVLYCAFQIPTRLAFNTKPNTLTVGVDYCLDVWFMCDVVFNLRCGWVGKAKTSCGSLPLRLL
jgi:hypothetical protein